uniref:tetratricopeptide repeat protein n=1 Tax=Flavobacterium sp. TaxID=239 RepID=UPI004049C66E
MLFNHFISVLKIILTVSFTFIVQFMHSQNTKIDSLEIALQNHKLKDTARVDILYHLAFATFHTDEELANKYVKEAEKLSNSLNYLEGKADVFQIKGIIESRKSNYKISYHYFFQALDIYTKLKKEKGINSINNAIGTNYYKQALYKEALIYYNKSIAYNEKINNKFDLIAGLYNTGNIYAETGEYEKAITNYNKVIKLSKEVNHNLAITYATNSLAIIYSSQGNYTKAISLYKNALYRSEIEKDTLSIASTLTSLGNLYRKTGEIEKAISFLINH